MKMLYVFTVMALLLSSYALIAEQTSFTKSHDSSHDIMTKKEDISSTSQMEKDFTEQVDEAKKVRLTELRIKEIEECMIVGKSRRFVFDQEKVNPVPAFWAECLKDGTVETLIGLPQNLHPDVLVGWYGDFNWEDDSLTCIVGVITAIDAPVPEGMTSFMIPTSRFAVGTIVGVEPDLYMMAHDLTMNKIEELGIEIDEERLYEIEWYDTRFHVSANEKLIDLYIPVK
ncbi:MAG: GyrI-like domain-containing protein [Candidatus Cloacimonetes bacterium]|nr:GyrI-like domain-containing protein [Candidatus Cloacimonadota bacterium]